MADPNELFHILKDTDGSGKSPDKAIDATTAAAALLGMVGFSFKDSSGNVVLPQLDSLGRLPVTASVGVCKYANGELAAGSLTLAAVTNAEIVLTASKTYEEVGVVISCRQAALYQIIWQDDATDNIIAEFIVGPGDYSESTQIHCFSFTAGATGTQKLKVKAKNFELLSSLRASIAVTELN